MSRAWLKKSRTQRFRTAMDAPPFIRCGARRIVYRRADLDAWQQQHLEAVGAAIPGHDGSMEDVSAIKTRGTEGMA
jgi:predicted DNA-binding transcriptional regulator AlpA